MPIPLPSKYVVHQNQLLLLVLRRHPKLSHVLLQAAPSMVKTNGVCEWNANKDGGKEKKYLIVSYAVLLR